MKRNVRGNEEEKEKLKQLLLWVHGKCKLQREVSCHSHLGVQFRNMRGNSHLTTALLGGGWVPEISKSFPHWQPAPRWRLLPYLANPGNPVMKPHAEKGNRHLSH